MPLFYTSSRGLKMSLSIEPIKYSVMQDSNMGKLTTTSYKLHLLHNLDALVCLKFFYQERNPSRIFYPSPFQFALLKSSITVVNICKGNFNHFWLRQEPKESRCACVRPSVRVSGTLCSRALLMSSRESRKA